MNTAPPQIIYLKDYAPYSYLIDDVHLTFRLDAENTRVISRINFRPNSGTQDRHFALHGPNLKLISAQIDGRSVATQVRNGVLTAEVPDAPFVWECEVEINPKANTALEGLYVSGGMFCTQCEAEGFRRITYYPDRPDVMANFTVRIESDLPVILSNGNHLNSGDGWVEWHDPWPKPAYLFALVAGDLVAHRDQFTTASGRDVELNIWVRPGDEGKCAYAMDALKRSMKWDEEVYGREYDLGVFNIVAVDDFNGGAMENKGLNIFNSRLVLASPETATDQDYARIEGVIAHEYFHNWTGNRITCRDWFQLCLKEGLTVFRDQQFSGDMRGHAIKRIDDVLDLRARQFREDAGPLAHAVRPESFVEINNFYTATVYEKGAEVIRMLKALVGDEDYAKALDLYFDRHDGQATTIEAWLKVFEDATGRDLGQFKLWYSQAGTPRIRVSDTFDNGQYQLHLTQVTPPTPGQPDKQPQFVPVAVGLLNPNGDEVLPTQVLELTKPEQTFTFDGFSSRPIPSILRGFSAPVILQRQSSASERAFLLAHDTDPFNKWEAGRALAKDLLINMITNREATSAEAYLEAIRAALNDAIPEPAFKALVLALPSEDDIAQTLADAGGTPDPTVIHQTRERLRRTMAAYLGGELATLYQAMAVPGPYAPDAAAAGQRALRNAALSLLTLADDGERALAQFKATDNMTEEFAALACLIPTHAGAQSVAAFYGKWRGDRLVMDKWFMIQTARAEPELALGVAKSLETHADFNWKNPNRFRSLLYGLAAANPAAFHAPDGAAYSWFAGWVIRVDPVNPQMAAGLVSAFATWARYDADRQGMINAELVRIAAVGKLSRQTSEMVARIQNG